MEKQRIIHSVWFIGLTVFTFFLLTHCGGKTKTDDLVRKDVVRKVDLKDVISQTGEVQPIIKVELKSEASGKIENVYVKEGERVKKGDKILKIDPTRLLTQKEKLDLAVQKAVLNNKLAKRDFDNAQKLYEMGQMPQNKLEDLKNVYELTKISLQEKELELNDVEYQLTKTLITAPMDGVLIALLVEEGEIAVSATSGFSGGTAIGTVADINKLEVVTQIGEVDYGKIKKDQIVQISMASDKNAMTSGCVSFVSLAAKKEANSNISSFEVRIAIDSLIPALVPGVNVNVDFIILEKKNITGVPYSMVQKRKRGNGEMYFVLRPSTGETDTKSGDMLPEDTKKEKRDRRGGRYGENVKKRMEKKNQEREEQLKKLKIISAKIKVGATDYRYYEVLEGLVPGDTVVKVLGGER
ncbi:MAG: efflux RND transporter periplasmic adaptor subunit [Fibrobacteria bacterium]|nr:efflux RND transporter periplasmic adaptor subunit [Fibrobacteria bacterium]